MHKPPGSWNAPTLQPGPLWKWHRVNKENNGKIIYLLQSWITTRPTVPVVIVNQAGISLNSSRYHPWRQTRTKIQSQYSAYYRLCRRTTPQNNNPIWRSQENIMQSYIKYKKYYDTKAKPYPLNEKDYCFTLQSQADHQRSTKTISRLLLDRTFFSGKRTTESHVHCAKT